jgi:Uma2 family endonuclease
MSTMTKFPTIDPIYPESDGKPIAENTKQYEWIVTIKENLDNLLPDAFVAADLFWYPVEGNPNAVQAPDIMVVKGRPKGHRRSYKQWQEAGIAPQIVFEILSSSNTWSEMARKLDFYYRHGVSEYYIYDPDQEELLGYTTQEGRLQLINDISYVLKLVKMV